MDTSHELDTLADLASIGLDELVGVDDLQTRTDRKYLVPLPLLPGLVDAIGPGARALTIEGIRIFRYQSIYFDTFDLACYLGAARRRPRRFKVRTRSYLDTGDCMLEVKTRDQRGRTVKHRHPYDLARRVELTDDARRFIASIDQSAAAVDLLQPTLITAYRRTTLVLADTHGDARVTIDIDLTWDTLDGRGTNLAQLAHLALVETKTHGTPCAFDRALWRAGHRPVTISKYCTGLAALRPGLPANKWNRVLRRHFDWLPATGP